MKQKKFRLLLLLVAMLGLCGCQMEVPDGKVARHYVGVGEIEFIDASVEQEEGSDLAIYQTRIKNNSKHTIKGLTIEVELENGRHTTIVTQDTLQPNDISGWIRCVGPSSLQIDDLKMTRFTIKMVDDNYQETVVTYDVGRDFYTYNQLTKQEMIDPLIKVEEIEFVKPTLLKKENDEVVLQTYLRNNSDYNLQSVMYTFEDEDGETYTLYSPLEIESQHQSSLLTTSSLPSTNWDDYQFKSVNYTYLNQETLVYMMYDVRLKQYFIK